MKITLKKNVSRKIKKSKKTKKNKINKMRGGELTKEIIEYIERLTTNDTTLIELDISNNNIDYIGVKLIAEALKVNKTLKKLEINSNNIGSKGAQYIAEALKINKTIEMIDIRNNNIEDIGAEAIKEALEINKTIEMIDIRENFISDEFITQLDKSKLKNNLNQNKKLNNIMDKKMKRQIIMVPQNKHSSLSRHSRTSKVTSLYKKALAKINEYKIYFICKDSGACLAFGKYSDIIKKHFDNFISFKYVNPLSKVTRIGTPSKNGFINEIAYLKNEYTSYAILKSSQKITGDNLMYEYKVGMFINYLNTVFPCFLETYGLYKYKDENSWEKYKDNKFNDSKDLKDDLEPINKLDYNIACSESKLLSILIQHLKGIESLELYVTDEIFVNYDLIYTLFQVYIPLCSVRDYFTHYDLHDKNVQIYEPEQNHYIEFHYHFTTNDILDTDTHQIISFKSSYIAKILDYGRSHFNFSKIKFPNSKEADNSNSEKVFEEICKAEKCNCGNNRCNCGYDKGFFLLNVPLQEKDNHYITPIKKNISHDLRLAYILTDEINVQRNKTFDFLGNIVYTGNGIPEDLNNGFPFAINNVNDLAKKLSKLIMTETYIKKNDKYNSIKTKLGDLHIYVDELKPMMYIPEKKLENMFS